MGLRSYLIILVLNAEALSQVSEHLWTVLFEFELPRKILSKEQTSFITLCKNNAVCFLCNDRSSCTQSVFNKNVLYFIFYPHPNAQKHISYAERFLQLFLIYSFKIITIYCGVKYCKFLSYPKGQLHPLLNSI